MGPIEDHTKETLSIGPFVACANLAPAHRLRFFYGILGPSSCYPYPLAQVGLQEVIFLLGSDSGRITATRKSPLLTGLHSLTGREPNERGYLQRKIWHLFLFCDPVIFPLVTT